MNIASYATETNPLVSDVREGGRVGDRQFDRLTSHC